MFPRSELRWAFLAYTFLNWTCDSVVYVPYPFTPIAIFARNAAVGARSTSAAVFRRLAVARSGKAVASLVSHRRFRGNCSDFAGRLYAPLTIIFAGDNVLSPAFVQAASFWIAASLPFATFVILLETFFFTPRENRQRAAWILMAFVVSELGRQVLPRIFDVSHTSRDAAEHQIILFIYIVSPLVLAAGVLYALTAYRVIGVRLAAGRALIYAVTTAAIVLIFSIAHWLASRMFESTNARSLRRPCVGNLYRFFDSRTQRAGRRIGRPSAVQEGTRRRGASSPFCCGAALCEQRIDGQRRSRERAGIDAGTQLLRTLPFLGRAQRLRSHVGDRLASRDHQGYRMRRAGRCAIAFHDRGPRSKDARTNGRSSRDPKNRHTHCR